MKYSECEGIGIGIGDHARNHVIHQEKECALEIVVDHGYYPGMLLISVIHTARHMDI